MKATVWAGLVQVGSFTLTIPLDAENNGLGDGIADKWEKEKVKEWNTQFGATVAVNNAYFGAGDDKELIDPDGANTDGGIDMPMHKTAGDSLNLIQEYHGFIGDGGGYDWNGNNRFTAFGIGGTTGQNYVGGHIRLSPAFKELLIEVDTMTGVTNEPADSYVSLMNDVSRSFSDATRGAGLRAFWVRDNVGLANRIFTRVTAANASEQTEETRDFFGQKHKNTKALSEFVHLIFAGDKTYNTTNADSNIYGSFVYVDRLHAYTITHAGWNFDTVLLTTSCHEITHLLLDKFGVTPFDVGEHLEDPAEDGNPIGTADYPCLMLAGSTPENRNGANIWHWENPSRRGIDLNSKESVERH